MEISLFESGLKSKQAVGKISISDFVQGVKFGKWKKEVEVVRTEPDTEKRKRLKTSTIQAVTVSGTFANRNADSLLRHSGFICMDIDVSIDRAALCADPYTYALFSSIGGGGVAIMVKINAEKHKQAFRWLQNYYFDNYGIVVDPAPQSVASLRYVSYDPALHLNEKSRTSRTLSDKPPKTHSLPMVMSTDKVGELVREVQQKGIDIAPDYDSYYRLAFALVSGFGEAGREYFHALCSNSAKYNSAAADRQYSICLKRPNVGTTVGTFYYMLREAGIQVNNENGKAVQIAAMAKKTGRSKEGVVGALVEINGVPEQQAQQIVDDVFKRDDITLKSIASDPEKLIESLVEWVKLNHSIRKNIITSKLEEAGTELSKERTNTIFLRARSAFNSPNVSFELLERVLQSEFTPDYHPLKEYISKHRHLNTTGNIDRLITTLKTNTQGADVFIRKWLMSLGAAIDGHPVRSVLALCGGQHTGKTEWFRRLVPEGLKRYYGESKLDNGKDDEILMCQKLIIMDDEMGGKSKEDEKTFKNLTSKQVFSLRAPYGRHNEDYRRLAVLCGTSNNTDLINDPTGNTRILPIEVISIDHEGFNSIDKDELFMEAYRLYERGEEWQLNKQELADLSIVSSAHETVPFERELILAHLKSPELAEYAEWLTATDLKNYLEIHSKQKIMSMRKFGIELKRVFGDREAKKMNNTTLWRYKVHKLRIDTNLTVTSQLSEIEKTPF